MSSFTNRISFLGVPKFHMQSEKRLIFAHLDPLSVTRLGPDSLKSLEKLWHNNKHAKYITKMFGKFQLEEILYKTYLTLGVYDSNQNLAGAMFLGVHPNIPAISPADWVPWIYEMYEFYQVNSYNSLWIQLLIWNPIYYLLFLKPMVQYLFKSTLELKFLLMVVPPGNFEADFFDKMGYPMKPKDNNTPKSQYIYVIIRRSFVFPYKLRGAVEEDNADITSLIENYSSKLAEIYGEFYIPELLTKFNNKKRKIIIAVYKDKAIGVLCLNDDVNYQLLLSEFEIGPYNGLKKAHERDFDNFLTDVFYNASTDQIVQTSEVEDFRGFLKKSVVEGKQSDEVIFNILHTESDDFSLVFTTSPMYFFQDDDDPSESNYTDSGSDYSLFTNIFKNLQKEQTQCLSNESVKLTTLQFEAKGRTRNPEFLGKPNAFSVEIIAVDPKHEECLLSLFECAFDYFPDKDYCVLTLPLEVEEHYLSRFFSNVPQRYDANSRCSLHVMHKNTILGDVSVKEMEMHHKLQIKSLLATIPNSTLFWQQLEKAMTCPESPVYCYVMLCQNMVIGVVLISEEFRYSYLRAHYDLYPVNYKFCRSGTQGIVQDIVVSPLFARFTKFFIREIHRMSEFDVLFYKLKVEENTAVYRERPLNNLLDYFLPMIPLQLPEFNAESLKEQGYNIDDDDVIKEHDLFSLYVSTISTCSMELININKNIVVVGDSSTAFSFIKTLVFTKNLYYRVIFNNLTLVSTQGFYQKNVSENIRSSFLVKKNFLQGRFLDEMNLRTYVNSVIGKVTQIRRKDKTLIINNEAALPYDLLFLMTGEIYLRPYNVLIQQKSVHKPNNLFIINCAADASTSLLKLKSLQNELPVSDSKIIVYGHYLQAFVTLGGLLSFGIPGRFIVFVEPFPYPRSMGKWHRQNVSIFNDPDVEEAVYSHIHQENVEIYSSYYFVEWECDDGQNCITSVKFESRHKMINIKCLAMFYYGEKNVQRHISACLNDAHLVYDGKLVIDNNYRTNDPSIYAAGTLTKYSRKYLANHLSHKYFSRSEIGEHLGQKIKEMILPEEVLNKEGKEIGWNFYFTKKINLLPKYVKPKMIYCKLPGNLHYFSVVKPGRRIPLEAALCMEDYGQVLITGNHKNLDEQGFFRLHLNTNGRVETITCLSKFPMDFRNLYRLWGKHETMLNNLQTRFQMVLIKDFFEYFRQPWAILLYHPKFEDLQNYINMVTTSIVGHDEESIVYKLINIYKSNKWKPISDDQYTKLAKEFKRISYDDIIQQNVLEFIEENLDQLPVYAHPKIIRNLLKGFELSNLFQ